MKIHYYTKDILNICKKDHLTVDDIFQKISKKYPEAWKSSIYRNVEELVKEWKLKKVIWIWKKAYFEKNIWSHIHLIDDKTWNIIDFNLEINFQNLPNEFNISKIDFKIFWEFNYKNNV